MSDLLHRFPKAEYIVELIKINPDYLSKLEYARRILTHLNAKIKNNNHILVYLLFIETVYY